MTDIAEAIRRTPWSASTVPLAWYDCDTYDEIKALMSDGRAFAPTYEQWEGYATRVEAFFVARGVATVRVHVDPREFAQWCSARRRDPDAKGRLAFSEWAAHSRADGKDVP
jgi:hypothetical protein